MTTTLRPGLLVGLKTNISGGVSYHRVDLEDATNDGGSRVARWETTRVIDNPEEYERATRARSAAGQAIRQACVQTAFGLLCPADRERDLDLAIDLARATCEEFNASSGAIMVNVYVLKGRIAQSDAEAAQAVASEVRDLFDRMNRAIAEVDVEGIRKAAREARRLGAVLEAPQAEKVREAVQAARDAASEVAKRIIKGGELAATVLAELQGERSTIEAARFAFLDLDAPVAVAELPAVDGARFAGIEPDSNATDAETEVQ